MNFRPFGPQTFNSDSWSSSVDQQAPLETRAEDRQGRVYRYARAGIVDLVAGNVLQGAPTIPNHLANTPPIVALGATSFLYTPGATAAAANYYAGGVLVVDTTPGNGYTYGIDSHGAITASTAFTLNLKSDDPIQVALTASSRVGLIPNAYNGVVQMPVTTATGRLVGVAGYVIPATQYGWIQTWGPASVLIAGTPALGASVMAPGAVAGAAEILTTTNLVVAQAVGTMSQVGVAGKTNVVFLTIRP